MHRWTALGVLLVATALVIAGLPAGALAGPEPVPGPSLAASAERDLGLRATPGATAASYAFYRDGPGGPLVVETDADDTEFTRGLLARYGSAVTIRPVAVSRAGRGDDGSPHFGGARIHLPNHTAGCSSGVVLIRARVRHMITAGHCYSAGANIYSGPRYYGLINIKRFPNPDLALINGNAGSSGQGSQGYTNLAFTDPGGPPIRTVSSRWRTVVGHIVCTGGGYSRERCGARVNTTNATFCDSRGCTRRLARAQNPGQLTAQLGDSGGPVYQKRGRSGLAFQGIIVATSLNLGDSSGDTVWFHTVGTIESALGGRVVTSPARSSPELPAKR
jgi:hypothetical protein